MAAAGRNGTPITDGRATDVSAFGYAASWTPLAAALVIALLVEMTAVHLLVSLVAVPVAVILTVMTLATVVWLIADVRAARRHPIEVTPDTVAIRIGLRWRVELPRASIVSVARPSGRNDQGPRKSMNLAMDGQPNVEIVLAGPVLVDGPMGQGRMADRLLIGVDDPTGFCRATAPG